jgi:hypothetical protein
METGCQIVE